MILSKKHKIFAAKIGLVLAVPILIHAYATGPDPRKTGAPGDQTCNAVGCHIGTNVNAGPGRVEILLAGAATYVPGEKQRIQVRVTDAGQRTFGFQATARLESNLSAGQAGTFTPIDRTTIVICDDGSNRPTAGCRANFPVEFIEHSLATTANTFSFDWTAPATNVGNVRIYTAGNAANGNGTEAGDRIYTTSIVLTPAGATAPPKPSISSGGVADAFNFAAGIAPNTWTVIAGSDFSTDTATWDSAIVNNRLPTSLANVSVTINNKPAAMSYVSPTQINVLAPIDIGTGAMSVVVKNANGESAPLTVNAADVKPALFTPFSLDSKLYVLAVALDATLVGKVADGSSAKRPVRPGETILVFGTGFGATNPTAPSDQVVSGAPLITTPVRIRFGETVAPTFGNGNLVYAGLYQFNVTVPDTLEDGEYQLIAEVGGVTSSTNVYITVQR